MEQSADHGAAQRRVLLAAFAEAQGHRKHSDDHRQGGHDDRPQARDARRQGGIVGVLAFACRWSLAKVIIRMLLEVATPMLMIAPISDGTLMVVPVRKSIHKIPARAPGRAMRMISGSSQDWKLITISR